MGKDEILTEFRTLLRGYTADADMLRLLMKHPVYKKYAEEGEIDGDTLKELVHNPGQFEAHDAVFGERAMEWVREHRFRIGKLFDRAGFEGPNPITGLFPGESPSSHTSAGRNGHSSYSDPSPTITIPAASKNGKNHGGKKVAFPEGLKRVSVFLREQRYVPAEQTQRRLGLPPSQVDGWMKTSNRREWEKPTGLENCLTILDGITVDNPAHQMCVDRTRAAVQNLLRPRVDADDDDLGGD